MTNYPELLSISYMFFLVQKKIIIYVLNQLANYIRPQTHTFRTSVKFCICFFARKNNIIIFVLGKITV